jgi:hypothetical protein
MAPGGREASVSQTLLTQTFSNEFVIELFGKRRRIARNGVYAHALTSTLIEACASQRRGLAISHEEHPRCVTIVCTLWRRAPPKLERR